MEDFSMSQTAAATYENGEPTVYFSVVDCKMGAIHPNDSLGEEICVLAKVYLDESADEKRERHFAVGGFVGIDDYWAELDAAWKERTKDLKEPFHSTDCDSFQGQFKGWGVSDRNTLMADLVDIVRASKIGGVGFFCPICDYADVFDSHGEYDAYYFCLKATMIFIANESESSKHGIYSEFMIEENSAANPTAAYKSVKGVEGWRASRRMISFAEGGKNIIGLQAADLMARESFKLIDNRGTGRNIRVPLLRLQDRVRIFGWSREGLEDLKRVYGSDDSALVKCITDSGGRGKIILTPETY
jgi:hypothetical protein